MGGKLRALFGVPTDAKKGETENAYNARKKRANASQTSINQDSDDDDNELGMLFGLPSKKDRKKQEKFNQAKAKFDSQQRPQD